MKAGGGKAAFRQAELFAFDTEERERYDRIAVSKVLYPQTVEVFSTEPVHFEYINRARSVFHGRLSELISRYASTCQAVLAECRDESASIDNGKLRLDMYDHRWFQLGLSWTTRHITYNSRTGEYPRRYIEIDLATVKEEYWPTLKAALDRFMPQSLPWSIVAEGAPTTHPPLEQRISIPMGPFALDDEQELMEHVNAMSASLIIGSGPHYYYRVDAASVDVSKVLASPSVCMAVVHGDERGIVGHPSQQHPLPDSSSTIAFFLPSCHWRDRLCSAIISYA